MASRRKRNASSLAVKSAELAFAAPQVVAHRMARMAVAGPVLSERDRREFQRMGAEKLTAFAESWNAMALQAARANQDLAAGFFRSLWSPLAWASPFAHTAAQLHSAALGVLHEGIDPVHREATANARRLARTKLR
jgi:hypothetical protein